VCSAWRMSKSAMPGHLIAVLVVLGVDAFVMPSLLFVLGALSGVLFAAPFLGVALLSLGSLALWGWFGWLVFALLTRRPRALRHARVTAAILFGIGGVCLGGVIMSPLWAATLFTGDLVVQLAFGLYLQWALGRADVRGWLAGPVAPHSASRPSGPE
jgi:hypothetical protein